MTERTAIRIALALNLALAVLELVAGLLTRSVALLADAADFVEDSALYLLILVMGGAKPQVKARFGFLLAGLMALPGLAAAWQVAARLVHPDPPDGTSIWAVSTLALLANLGTVAALTAARRTRAAEDGTGGQSATLGFRAAWLSSRNDALANLAMIGAGIAVAVTRQGWPDIVVGLGVAALHLSGGIAIWRAAADERRRAAAPRQRS
jgi:Co/Zn/Cd efflux system component